MDFIPVLISASITIFSCGLLIVSLLSYKKYRTMKLLVVSLVFLVFLVRGLLMSAYVFSERMYGIYPDPVFGVFDIFILLLLLFAALKR